MANIILNIIIKFVISICFMIFIIKPSYSEKAILESVFSFFFSFMMGYTMCSLIQMLRPFTCSFFPFLSSLAVLMLSCFSWLHLLPEAEKLGFKFAVSLILAIFVYSAFFLYDIFKLIPIPGSIQKLSKRINKYEVIDIPRSGRNAVIKLIQYVINKNKKEKKANDIQDASGE